MTTTTTTTTRTRQGCQLTTQGKWKIKKMNNKTSNILSIKFIQKDLDRRLLSGVPNLFEVKTIEKFDQTGAKWQNAAIDFERVFVTFQRM